MCTPFFPSLFMFITWFLLMTNQFEVFLYKIFLISLIMEIWVFLFHLASLMLVMWQPPHQIVNITMLTFFFKKGYLILWKDTYRMYLHLCTSSFLWTKSYPVVFVGSCALIAFWVFFFFHFNGLVTSFSFLSLFPHPSKFLILIDINKPLSIFVFHMWVTAQKQIHIYEVLIFSCSNNLQCPPVSL